MGAFVMLVVLFLVISVVAYLYRNSDGQIPNDWTSL